MRVFRSRYGWVWRPGEPLLLLLLRSDLLVPFWLGSRDLASGPKPSSFGLSVFHVSGRACAGPAGRSAGPTGACCRTLGGLASARPSVPRL